MQEDKLQHLLTAADLKARFSDFNSIESSWTQKKWDVDL